jgi:hypothetical protein
VEAVAVAEAWAVAEGRASVDPCFQMLMTARSMSSESTHNPTLFEVNTRVTLANLSRQLGRQATLDDYPESELVRLAGQGFDWIWFLGVWQTGPKGRQVSLNHASWLSEYRELLPDFTDDDVCGSCFAIQHYSGHSDFGGDAAIARLRDRVHAHGMRLMLDFVPNHTAPDHPWVQEHPEFYIHGDEELLAREPQNYARTPTADGSTVLAYGRDPYFDGWPDTFQLNYANPNLQEEQARVLEKIATLCDGVRCDMAMLVLPDVFERTWGHRPTQFWPPTIQRIRAANPGFVFMAEVYWDMEWILQQHGFDYTYDKRLYDRLHGGHAPPVRDHFRADIDFQHKSARFLENHDEPRAAATFESGKHKAAAILTFFSPGLRFFHQGQQEGFRRRIPVHLGRGPKEEANSELETFYARLLQCLKRPELRHGKWSLLEAAPAWDSNWTWDCFIGFAWEGGNREILIVAVNFAPNRSQCYLRLPVLKTGGTVTLTDLMGHEVHERSGVDLDRMGLYLDLPGWACNVFEVRTS